MKYDVTNPGAGIYFDGVTGRRHAVEVSLIDSAVRISGEQVYARWPYDKLEHLSAPEGMLRLGRADAETLERLEIRDPELAHAIDERSVPVDRSGKAQRRVRGRVIIWSMAAVTALLLMAVYGVPALADRLTPYIPHAFEAWMGKAVDVQVRAMLDTKNAGSAFECGVSGGQAGIAALQKIMSRLERAAGLPIPLQTAIVRRSEANAITLPGGHIYVFEGLIRKAENADELAGVLAHEIGHAAHRDGARAVLQTAGISFLFGMVLGDFVGGGAVVIAAKTILNSSYSREAEAAADLYGVELMNKIGADARALAAFLQRIDGSSHSQDPRILLDHPDARQRIAAINAAAAPQGAPAQLLDPGEWAALKQVCAGR